MQRLTVEEVMLELGVTSERTRDAWLYGGSFPGAVQNADGVWSFDSEQVALAKQTLADLKRLNKERDFAPPDADETDIPFL